MTTRRYALRDDQWQRSKDLLPGRVEYVGVTAKDNRLVIEAVLYRDHAGIAWRDLAARLGDLLVIHTRFSRWSKTGVWERVFQDLAADADNDYAMIDRTIARAYFSQCGRKSGEPAQEAIERSYFQLSTKIQAIVDALGNPLIPALHNKGMNRGELS
jgi:transposase